MNENPLVIIGSGIAGLYTAYKLIKLTNKNFIILEQNDRIGGRIYTEVFEDIRVVGGAGIGRYEKDVLLKKLLVELSIPVPKPKETIHHWINIPESTKNLVTTILNMVDTTKKGSFESVVTEQFGQKNLKKFVEYVGYTDFLKEDVRETIFHYGMEDNFESIKTFYVDWYKLIQKISDKIGKDKIFLNTKVLDISTNENKITYQNRNGIHTLVAKEIILATDINLTHHVFPHNRMLKYVQSQPFARLYVKFSPKSAKIIRRYIIGYTIVSSILQKIIPISPDNGIYMIAYNDNKNSITLGKLSTSELEDAIRFSLGIHENLEIISKRLFFWDVGTHYFEPYPWKFNEWNKVMSILQHPSKNVYTVGEAFSFNQGWTEGALESVENLFSIIFQNNTQAK